MHEAASAPDKGNTHGSSTEPTRGTNEPALVAPLLRRHGSQATVGVGPEFIQGLIALRCCFVMGRKGVQFAETRCPYGRSDDLLPSVQSKSWRYTSGMVRTHTHPLVSTGCRGCGGDFAWGLGTPFLES